jgi:hypothetical protein
MPKKAIQGTPWYNILSNPQYAEDFNYIGAFVDEREKLIKDGDNAEGNDTEQSDLVVLLLNLAAIPDEVAKNFDFKAGFSKEFVQLMENYKKKFTQEQTFKWEYMNEENISRYISFK